MVINNLNNHNVSKNLIEILENSKIFKNLLIMQKIKQKEIIRQYLINETLLCNQKKYNPFNQILKELQERKVL